MVVKLAASIEVIFSAARHNSELAAKAIIAKTTRATWGREKSVKTSPPVRAASLTLRDAILRHAISSIATAARTLQPLPALSRRPSLDGKAILSFARHGQSLKIKRFQIDK
jgi:hypothetical protein